MGVSVIGEPPTPEDGGGSHARVFGEVAFVCPWALRTCTWNRCPCVSDPLDVSVVVGRLERCPQALRVIYARR